MITLMIALLLGQTRLNPNQVVNPNQLRIGADDTRPVTLWSLDMIADGRFILPADYYAGDPIVATRPKPGDVCIVTWFSISPNGADKQQNYKVDSCFTDEGLAEL